VSASAGSETVAVPFVDLTGQHAELADELAAAFERVLATSRFVLGEELEAFESEFAAVCEAPHCVAVRSGSEALHLTLRACGIEPGDEVIVPSHTFVATALAVSWVGAVPVFVDIDETYTLDPARVADALTHRTRAIVPVHLYGQCADMDPLIELAERHGLSIVEDAAQAHGATYNGRTAGSLGHAACFSFYPSKNLGALGDGGAVVTSDAALAAGLRSLRDYGRTERYRHETLGWNGRLDELQAAFLRVKLPHLPRWNAARARAADRYCRTLVDTVATPRTAPGRGHVFHLFVIRSPRRAALQEFLAANSVATQVHYPVPVHLQPVYRKLPHRSLELRATEKAAAEVLSLPLFPTITTEQVERIVALVREHGG
jgi:dTDP-4-amino-4,6-dideoxygalactose transaminase